MSVSHRRMSRENGEGTYGSLLGSGSLLGLASSGLLRGSGLLLSGSLLGSSRLLRGTLLLGCGLLRGGTLLLRGRLGGSGLGLLLRKLGTTRRACVDMLVLDERMRAIIMCDIPLGCSK